MTTSLSRRGALLSAATLCCLAGLAGLRAQAPLVTREPVAGVRNFARVETTVACAGATGPEAMAAIRKMGFVAVVNLRLATENGANVEAEAEAARAAGLRYVHTPLSGPAPEFASIDPFIAAMRDPANQPAFIHCASGVRASTAWMIKRVLVDHWDIDKAAAEAEALNLTDARFKQFALDYIRAHQ